MQLKTFVKASSINNLSDARYFSAYNVDFLGFDCNNTSSNFVSTDAILELTNWINGPKTCLEAHSLSNEEINELSNKVGSQAIQVLDSHDVTIFTDQFIIFRTLSLSLYSTFDLLLNQCQKHKADYFIIDFDEMPATDLLEHFLFKENKINELNANFKILIQANITAQLVDRLLNYSIHGLSIKGGTEEKVGLRSFDDVQDIMETLEQ